MLFGGGIVVLLTTSDTPGARKESNSIPTWKIKGQASGNGWSTKKIRGVMLVFHPSPSLGV